MVDGRPSYYFLLDFYKTLKLLLFNYISEERIENIKENTIR